MKKTLTLGLAGLSLISSGFCSEHSENLTFQNFIDSELRKNSNNPSVFMTSDPHNKVLRLEQNNSKKKNRNVSAATLQKEMEEDWDKIKNNEELISELQNEMEKDWDKIKDNTELLKDLQNEMTEVAKTINFKKKRVSKKEEASNTEDINTDTKVSPRSKNTGDAEYQHVSVKNNKKPNDSFIFPSSGSSSGVDIPDQTKDVLGRRRSTQPPDNNTIYNNTIYEELNEDGDDSKDLTQSLKTETENNQFITRRNNNRNTFGGVEQYKSEVNSQKRSNDNENEDYNDEEDDEIEQDQRIEIQNSQKRSNEDENENNDNGNENDNDNNNPEDRGEENGDENNNDEEERQAYNEHVNNDVEERYSNQAENDEDKNDNNDNENENDNDNNNPEDSGEDINGESENSGEE